MYCQYCVFFFCEVLVIAKGHEHYRYMSFPLKILLLRKLPIGDPGQGLFDFKPADVAWSFLYSVDLPMCSVETSSRGWGVHSTAQQLRSIHGGNQHLTAGGVMRHGHFLLQLRRMKQMLFNHFHRNVGRKAPFVNLQIDALCGCDMKSCNHQIQNGTFHREHEWWKMMEDVESMVFRGYDR